MRVDDRNCILTSFPTFVTLFNDLGATSHDYRNRRSGGGGEGHWPDASPRTSLPTSIVACFTAP